MPYARATGFETLGFGNLRARIWPSSLSSRVMSHMFSDSSSGLTLKSVYKRVS
jgi:hypothetical protein